MSNKKVVLTIGGSDSGGGAGIQADLKTMEALGCFGITVITAITAQNTKGVQAVYPLPLEQIRSQLQSVFDDFDVATIKIGMLGTAEIIHLVYDFFHAHNVVSKIVLDPVLISTSGHRLMDADAIQELICIIYDKLTYIITPNIPEAETIFDVSIRDENSYFSLANKIAINEDERFPLTYLKGGHGKAIFNHGNCIDLFCNTLDHAIDIHENKFIEGGEYHGTGCTLSSALACFLAHEYPLQETVKNANLYVNATLKNAPIGIGSGNRVLNHHIPWDIKN